LRGDELEPLARGRDGKGRDDVAGHLDSGLVFTEPKVALIMVAMWRIVDSSRGKKQKVSLGPFYMYHTSRRLLTVDGE
jgi:hypothetical protein